MAADDEAANQKSALIACVRAGDALAARTFYDLHVTDVYRMAVRLTRDPELARECTQDVFVRAFDRLHQFRGDGPLAAWLGAITRSVVLNTLRHQAPWKTAEVSLDDVEIATESIEEERSDRLEALIHALRLLPTVERYILRAFYGEGNSHQEIAAALGITVGTSKVRLSRARARIRRLMGMDRCPPVNVARR